MGMLRESELAIFVAIGVCSSIVKENLKLEFTTYKLCTTNYSIYNPKAKSTFQLEFMC